MKNILILGATSAMAQACARQWVARGDRVFLVGRREAALAADADDLRLRGREIPWAHGQPTWPMCKAMPAC